MEIKTYGVEGYMDWQCEIPVGRARAIVHFTGGAMTAYGVTPAEYSTGDPVRQKIIEGSAYFKQGRIKFLRSTGTPDPVKPRAAKSIAAPTPAPVAPAPSEAPVAVDNTADAVVAPAADDMSGPGIESQDTESVEILAEVPVSCLPEAQNYLRDHFGIPTSKSRSKEKAQTFARENGIIFIGLE